MAWKLVFEQVQHRRSLLNVDIGLLEWHCFYIKNVDVLTDHGKCAGCKQRFSHHTHYNRHMTEKWCTSGQPKLMCDSSKFKCIMSSSEKVFYGGIMQFSWKDCRWIKCLSELSGWHIRHALCGHGGEGCVDTGKNEVLVDRYNPETSTVYQFYKCKWHGCPCLGSASDRYQNTLSTENQIQSRGHNVVSVWECENGSVCTFLILHHV